MEYIKAFKDFLSNYPVVWFNILALILVILSVLDRYNDGNISGVIWSLALAFLNLGCIIWAWINYPTLL